MGGRGQEKPFIYSLPTQPYEVPINFTTSLHFCPVFLLFSWQELPNSTYSLSTGPEGKMQSFLPHAILFIIIIILLEDNCFTILCWFPLYINMNQPQVYVYPLPPESPAHLPPHSPLQVITEHCVDSLCQTVRRELCVAELPLAICFTCGNVYVFILFSQCDPPSPSPTVATSSVLYVCVSIAALQIGSSVPSF